MDLVEYLLRRSMKTMESGVCSTFFLEQMHGGAAGVGCVWRRKFGVELFYWFWSCVELSQTHPKSQKNPKIAKPILLWSV
jgi:hypothetical protein